MLRSGHRTAEVGGHERNVEQSNERNKKPVHQCGMKSAETQADRALAYTVCILREMGDFRKPPNQLTQNLILSFQDPIRGKMDK